MQNTGSMSFNDRMKDKFHEATNYRYHPTSNMGKDNAMYDTATAALIVMGVATSVANIMYAKAHEENHKNEQIAAAVAASPLKIDLETPKGMVNLNALTAKERKQKISEEAQAGGENATVQIAITDPKEGYLCTVAANANTLTEALNTQYKEFKAENADKYAKQIGKACNLPPEKIELLNKHFRDALQPNANLSSPYNANNPYKTVTVNGAEIGERVATPENGKTV